MHNIAFFGSSEYSLIILKKLLTLPNYSLKLIVSKTDKPVGRKQEIIANPVADFAKKNNLPLVQLEEFTSDFNQYFQSLNLDLALVVAFGPPYFTQQLIDIPTHKIVNIHPSPLPKYRGATPGPWQIIKGETQSAVTFFQIDALPDHGPIIAQLPLQIDISDTSESFYHKAFNLAADSLQSILDSYLTHPDNLITQDHSQKTYFPKLNKDTAQVDWSKTDFQIYNFIRALHPWPIAWTFVQNQQGQTLKMKLISAEFTNNKLSLKDVQIEGKKPVCWCEISSYYSIVKK